MRDQITELTLLVARADTEAKAAEADTAIYHARRAAAKPYQQAINALLAQVAALRDTAESVDQEYDRLETAVLEKRASFCEEAA